MTIGTTQRSVTYNGSGTPGSVFDVPFRVYDEDHFVVTKTAAGPVVTNPAFTVTGIGTDDCALTLTGGVTIVTGETLTIERVVPLLQAIAFADGATFPSTIERACDLLVQMVQQQQDAITDLEARVAALEA